MAFFINYVFCSYCIKVATLLNKIADLPKEHFSPLNPILYFQLLYLRLLCCCSRDLFILPAGTGNPAVYHARKNCQIYRTVIDNMYTNPFCPPCSHLRHMLISSPLKRSHIITVISMWKTTKKKKIVRQSNLSMHLFYMFFLNFWNIFHSISQIIHFSLDKFKN